MYPILFGIGRLNVYTHGTLIALGSLFGGIIIFYLAKKAGLKRRFLFDLLIYCLFAGIVGARFVYVISYFYQFTTWYEMFYIWQGGLVSFGGIFFGFLTAYLILRKHHEDIGKWFDIGIIGLLFGWSLGRIGCLLAGDIVGVTSHGNLSIWAQIPVPLFEAIWCFILASILFYFSLYQKPFLSRFRPGAVFIAGLGAYALGRFVIDFWRFEKIYWFLKAGQITSLVILISCVIIFILYFRKKQEI